LWQRGDPGDPQAIRIIPERSPAATPDWLKPPAALAKRGTQLVTFPTERELQQVPRLLMGRYWRQSSTPESIRRSHVRSSAWVGALDRDGTLIGVARALGDAAARGVLYDVVVDEAFQRQGSGGAWCSSCWTTQPFAAANACCWLLAIACASTSTSVSKVCPKMK